MDKPEIKDCIVSPPAKSDRLIGPHGGVRAANCTSGPTVTNCRFESLEDDGIVVQHTLSPVTDILNNNTITIGKVHPVVAQVGDEFGVLSKTGIRKGRLPPVADMTIDQQVGAQDSRAKPGRIIFEEEVDDKLQEGDLVGNLATASRDFTVRNNVIRNHRGRLIRISASQGIVENNTLVGSHLSAIKLESESTIEPFAAKGWVTDVVVKSNKIVRPGLNYFAGEWPAGIRLHHSNPPDTPTEGQPNRNIAVIDNTVTNGAYCGILLEDARDIQVEGNDLSSLNRIEYPGVGDSGFILRGVDYVTLTNNSVTGGPAHMQYFGIERESSSIETASNQFQIGGKSEPPDLISVGRLQLRFNRAAKSNTGRYLSFLCRDLALLDEHDEVILTVDVGTDESGIEFGEGVDRPEKNANGDWRWFGSQTNMTSLFFANPYLEKASKLRLRGEPYEEGISATVYVGKNRGETIKFGERRTETYIVSLP